MCKKFHYNRLRNDRALENWKFDNKNPKKNNVRSHWRPFPGPKTCVRVLLSFIIFFHLPSNVILICVLLGRPEPPFRTGLCFTADVFLGSHISEVPRPITTKLCHMIGIWLKRSRKLQKFLGRSPKNIGGQKHAKFPSIFCTVRLWLRISPKRLKVSKS